MTFYFWNCCLELFFLIRIGIKLAVLSQHYLRVFKKKKKWKKKHFVPLFLYSGFSPLFSISFLLFHFTTNILASVLNIMYVYYIYLGSHCFWSRLQMTLTPMKCHSCCWKAVWKERFVVVTLKVISCLQRMQAVLKKWISFQALCFELNINLETLRGI